MSKTIKIIFKQDYKSFKAGQEYIFEGNMNILSGINGAGKSQFLEAMKDYCTNVFINDIRLNDLYSKEEIEEAKNNPSIIHYLCEQKPWQGFYKYSTYWWKVALKTPYKFYFIFIFIKNLLNPIPKTTNFLKLILPKKTKNILKEYILKPKR